MITERKMVLIRRIEEADATPFQKRVWKVLLEIPRGQTRSYSWVARRVELPRAVRAVGNALGKNPFAPLVPCHRVVRKDGSLGGYTGGLRRKKSLLLQEGIKL